MEAPSTRLDALLFGETQSRALLTTRAENAASLVESLTARGVPARQIGMVGGNALAVQVGGSAPREWTWEVAALHRAWDGALESYLS